MAKCKICGESYPETRQYWYFRRGKREGLKCRECEKQLARAGYRIPLCECCGEPIPDALNGKRKFHTDDNHPKCQEAHQANKRAAWARYNRNRRKYPHEPDKPKQFKICPICGKRRMEPQDHFSCRVCRKLAGDCSGNWVYFAPINDTLDTQTENL